MQLSLIHIYTFTIIPGALGKEDEIFAGDIEIDLDTLPQE